MNKGHMFAILSTAAPLIEVAGDGPTSDLVDGLTIVDGTVTIAPAQLHERSVRSWRVDAPTDVRTSIVVESPLGAFVGVRRRFAVIPARPRWCAPARWPCLRRVLKRRIPSLLALWHLYGDEAAPPMAWHDVGDGASHQAFARGGDVITVTFVVASEERRHA